MSFPGEPLCTHPPHHAELAPAGQQVVAVSAAARFHRWLAHAPAERAPLPAIPAIWVAAWVMHWAGVPVLYVAALTVAATGAAYGIGERRRAKNPKHKRLRGTEVAAVTAAAGAWLTAAAAAGPLAGPWHLLSLIYLTAAVGGYWWLRRHEAVQAARERRDAAARWVERKTWWHRLAPQLGLQGSHLLKCEPTRLGEAMVIDARSVHGRTSTLQFDAISEKLAEIEDKPLGRIDVYFKDSLPGRIHINIRREDPWVHPVTHPVLDPGSRDAHLVATPTTCHKPLVIGMDPETGAALPLPLWDEIGGKVILVAGTKGAGKTTALNVISERITACEDVIFLVINLAKHREDRRWARLAAASALGRRELGKARLILQWAYDFLEDRSETIDNDEAKVIPSPKTPLLVIKIDEYSKVISDPACKELLTLIAAMCRSEGVTLICANQRATAQASGGADIQANIDIAVAGQFNRAREERHVTGSEVELPSMSAYGEGNKGVFLVYELAGGGDYDRGRVFDLHKISDIEAIVDQRLATRKPWVPPNTSPRLASLWEATTSWTPDDGDRAAPGQVHPHPAAAHQVIPDSSALRAKISAAWAVNDGAPAQVHPLPAPGAPGGAHPAPGAPTPGAPAPSGEAVLLELLARPDGISTRQAAEIITAKTGQSLSHQTVQRALERLETLGHAEVRGGHLGPSFRRWYLTRAPGEAPPAPYPPLAPVGTGAADTGEDEDEDAAGNAP
jgi:hypothetical protein